ncbi:MAG: hypothetical protein KF760_00565 [Candidatus Eremiobacteraeota bacterium]|nr:hypothetical protein [Candidatus Eremiobacteraeota bacterium]MCW5867219.1 hypothetical protein [Candidatus Eremiobacteraeota bacterium]
MKLPKGLRRRKGVALILALLTTVILVTLSLAFMSLSLSEARTSRSYGYEETSVQAASYGLEYALTYMGRGTVPGQSIWEWKRWPNPGNNPSLNFGFYNVLAEQTGPVTVGQEIPSAPDQRIAAIVTKLPQDTLLRAFIPANLPQADKDQLELDLRRISIVDQNLKPRLIQLNSDLAFTCDVVVEPILLSRGQGRHDYRLISTARVYALANGAEVNVNAPVASRVVEARVKESSFDYAHFIANGRTWNVNGYTPGTTPSNANGTDLADYVVIPKDYVEQGPMRVDGQDVDSSPAGSIERHVKEQAGNLRFLANSAENGPKFSHKLTINQPANVYPDDVTDSTMSGFTAGFVPRSARIGIPDFRQEDMKLAAKLVVKDSDQSGLIEIPTAAIPGARGSALAAPKSSDPTNPFYDGTEVVTDSDGNTRTVNVPVDFRPRFPNVEIVLNKDQIQIQTRSTLDGSITDSRTIKQDQLQSGLIYVQGGNVVVKTDPTNKFQGKLSIVAGEDPNRDGFTPNDSSIYSEAARGYFTALKNEWDQTVLTTGLKPADVGRYPTPPYTIAQLNEGRTRFGADVVPPVESGMPSGQLLWPAPPVERDQLGNKVRYTTEREGNVVIADDVKYNEKSGNQLGLFAQNFVLLNDNTPKDPVTGEEKLTIDAVLVSKERTVSLDWDNTGRQPAASWKELMAPRAAGQPQRQIAINGSVIGEYIDVEGDQLGRGYKNQEFKYDLSLRNANPPFMPRPDLAALPGGFRFMILHYLDRGSLSTAGILGP